MSEIDPRLPENVGGGSTGGAHILSGKKAAPPVQQEPPKEPWDPEFCYRVTVGLDATRIYFVADNQDDKTSGIGPVPGGHRLDGAWSVDRQDETCSIPTTLRRHKMLCFMGLGIIIEIVTKPKWWVRTKEEKPS